MERRLEHRPAKEILVASNGHASRDGACGCSKEPQSGEEPARFHAFHCAGEGEGCRLSPAGVGKWKIVAGHAVYIESRYPHASGKQ